MMHQGHGCQGRSPVYPSPASSVPLSNASYNPVSSLTWSQAPPIQMPWAFPYQQSDGVVRFSAEPNLVVSPQSAATSLTTWVPAENFHGEWIPRVSKRKPDEDGWIGPARKQLLTEEKMAENMSRLNLTGSHTEDVIAEPSEETPTSMASTTSQEPKLVLSDELKSIVSEPSLPLLLLEQMQKPTMAVVLWKPPEGVLSNISARSSNRVAIPAPSRTNDTQENGDMETLEEDLDLDNNNSSSFNLNEMERNPPPLEDLEMAEVI